MPIRALIWVHTASPKCHQLAQPLAGASTQSNTVWTVRLSAAQTLSDWRGVRVAQPRVCQDDVEYREEGHQETFTFLALDFVLGDRIHLCKLQPEGQIFCLALN